MHTKNAKVINYKTLAVDDKRYLLYRKGNIYFSEDAGKTVEIVGGIPITGIKKIFTKFRVTTRLFRLEPRATSIVSPEEFLISYSGKIYYVNVLNKTINDEFCFREGMNNPLTFTSVEDVEGFTSGIYFGEYFSNNNHDEVSIYRRTEAVWSKVYTFPKGEIYHIHGIVPDKKRKCMYILTGDANNESAIWEAKRDFQYVKPILRGEQAYRSCVAFPVRNGILYATDTSREQNYLYYAEEKNENWNKKIICEMPGPCIYGNKFKDEYYFATSVEPDDTLSDTRFRFTYKLGKGVKDRYTYIVKCNDAGKINTVMKFKKDFLPMLLFQFGNCLFPECINTNNIVISPMSVKKYDGKTIVIGCDKNE